MALTDIQIRNLKPTDKPYKRTDGDGLILEVRPTGAKIWRYRYRQSDGKESMHTIGEYPEIGLAAARDERKRVRELVKQGINPTSQRKIEIASRREERDTTLRAVAESWREEMEREAGWSDKYRSQVQTYLERDLLAEYGHLPINSVTSSHILDAIDKVKKRGALSIAKLVQQWTGAVMAYAIRKLYIDQKDDPTYPIRGNIRTPKPRHHPHLDATRIPDFLAALRQYQGFGLVPLAVRLQMLTFVRTQELRLAKWEQFDLDNQVWRLPAESMKMDDRHLVPLARQTIELLHQIRDINWRKSEHLFPNMRRPDTVMTATTINRAIEIMGFKGELSGHGFRGTASTILHEHGFEDDWIEIQLAHMRRNSTARAYDHAKYLPHRREMMQWWADYLDEQEKKPSI